MSKKANSPLGLVPGLFGMRVYSACPGKVDTGFPKRTCAPKKVKPIAPRKALDAMLIGFMSGARGARASPCGAVRSFAPARRGSSGRARCRSRRKAECRAQLPAGRPAARRMVAARWLLCWRPAGPRQTLSLRLLLWRVASSTSCLLALSMPRRCVFPAMWRVSGCPQKERAPPIGSTLLSLAPASRDREHEHPGAKPSVAVAAVSQNGRCGPAPARACLEGLVPSSKVHGIVRQVPALRAKRSSLRVRVLACLVALLFAMTMRCASVGAEPAIDFAALAHATGTPDIPGLKVVWLAPWGD